MMKHTLPLLFAALGANSAEALAEGDTVCVDGFVMDFFCINRGTLFDNPSVGTLDNPGVHSVHCLVDVNSCVNSPFEILLDPKEGESKYIRGFRLTDTAKQTVLTLARETGSPSLGCTTCDASAGGTVERGFRVVTEAKIADLTTTPPLLDVIQVQSSVGVEEPCKSVYNMQTIQEVIAAENSPVPEPAETLEEGDTVCIDGFVMDFFCINRGTLFDNPSVETLGNPGVHSVHCLVDVNSCVNSPYEILLDPKEGESKYSRGFRLTDTAKQTVLALARETGSPSLGCTTCDASAGGTLERGFRVVTEAKIVDLSTTPPLVDVVQVQSSVGVNEPCMTVFNMKDVQEILAAQVAAGDSNSVIDIFGPSGGESGRTKLQKQQLAHGALMMIGWGWLLPSGALIAKFFKHRPNGLWFKIHRACQIFGLVCALTGWIIALKNFNVFGDKGFTNYKHGVMGMTVMIGGLLQPINALMRPHPPEEGQQKTSSRQVWEIVHKGLGYCTLLLAIATIGLGTTVLPKPEEQKQFQLAYGLGAGGLLVALTIFMIIDKNMCPEDEKKAGGESKDVEEQPAGAAE